MVSLKHNDTQVYNQSFKPRGILVIEIKCVILLLSKRSHKNFYPLAFQAEGVLLLPASVHLSFCLETLFYYMITHHKSELELPNLHLVYSWLVLKMEVIDLDLQVNFGHFDSEF